MPDAVHATVVSAMHGEDFLSGAPAPPKDEYLKQNQASDTAEAADDVPYCSLIGKIVTTLFHCGIVAFILGLMAAAPHLMGLGDIAIQLTAMHIALLLGLWGPKAGSFKHVWVPDPVHETMGVALFLVIGIIHYIGVAMIHFYKTEGRDALGPGMHGTFGEEPKFIDMLWFCMVLLTTVGYGNTFTPSSPASRSFTILWSLYGLFLFGAGAAVIQQTIGAVTDAISSALTKMYKKTANVEPEETVVQPMEGPSLGPGNGTRGFEAPDEYYIGRGLFFDFIWFVGFAFASSLIFWQVEAFAFQDAFYHVMMTSTTIGLGDIAPVTEAGRLIGIFNMMISVVLLGAIIGTILSALDRRVASQRKAEFLKKQLDINLIQSLDRDGDGVDRAEFVLGMLERLDVITKSDYEPFLLQFQRFDATGDGRLMLDDLTALAQANQKEAEEAKAKAAEFTYRKKLEGHAHDLMVPTFLAAFGFLWNSLYGYFLLAAGILQSIAIGLILGERPNPKTYNKITMYIGLAIIFLLAAVTYLCLFLADPQIYLDLDPVAAPSFFGQFNADGYTRVMDNVIIDPYSNLTMHEYMINMFKEANRKPSMLVFFILYTLMFVYAIGINVMTIVCVKKSTQELMGSAS